MQASIVAGLRRVGCQVFLTSSLGHGAPDVLCYYPPKHRWAWLEVKGPRGRLTPDERQWHEQHPGVASIVRTLDEALTACGVEVLSSTEEVPAMPNSTAEG